MLAFSTWPPLLLVALGGGMGACLRYLVGRWSLVTFGPGVPLGTWIVNISGGLVMGLLAGWLGRQGSDNEPMRLLLGVGVLGGFTTFSAFSLELVTMVNRGEVGLATAYAVSSVAGATLAVFAGLWLARA
jgi:CrcB protein